MKFDEMLYAMDEEYRSDVDAMCRFDSFGTGPEGPEEKEEMERCAARHAFFASLPPDEAGRLARKIYWDSGK